MRVLITGNMGYIGPVVVAHLSRVWPQAELIGYDNAYFAHCLTTTTDLPERHLSQQIFGDVRDLPDSVLVGVDAVVHLAAVSNDPMGHRFEAATAAINHQASVRIGAMARDAGVQHFVFASSCSVYGSAEGGARREEDPLNPLTAYAKSKIETEHGLQALDAREMTVSCLRFATACGMSPRLRLDLVLNDFVASALLKGEIKVLSDGTPWRPLIDVSDMARAIEWAATRNSNAASRFLSLNVGRDDHNHQVKDLAVAVSQAVPNAKVEINHDAPPDKRSYRVDFGRFLKLAPDHQPLMTLQNSIDGLVRGIRAVEPAALGARAMRLATLETHIAGGLMSADMRWTAGEISVAPALEKVRNYG